MIETSKSVLLPLLDDVKLFLFPPHTDDLWLLFLPPSPLDWFNTHFILMTWFYVDWIIVRLTRINMFLLLYFFFFFVFRVSLVFYFTILNLLLKKKLRISIILYLELLDIGLIFIIKNDGFSWVIAYHLVHVLSLVYVTSGQVFRAFDFRRCNDERLIFKNGCKLESD